MSEQRGETIIFGGGIAACLLAVQLIRKTGWSVCLHCGPRRPELDYQLLVDRTSLLDFAHLLALSESTVLRRCRPVSFTYSAWESKRYTICDHYVGLDGGKFALQKSDLEDLARRAARLHGVRLCSQVATNPSSNDYDRGPSINARGRAAFKRNHGADGTRHAVVNRYLRFVCSIRQWTVDGADSAHILDAVSEGWLSVLPISSNRVEIMFYTDQYNDVATGTVCPARLWEIVETSPILKRLAAGSLEIRWMQTGFTVVVDQPAIADSNCIAVGDALFPIDPLAGLGVRFTLRSTELATDLIAGEVSASAYVAFNHHISKLARAHHEQRHTIYSTSRWYGLGKGYWRRQADFSRRAAGVWKS